jgi:integrase
MSVVRSAWTAGHGRTSSPGSSSEERCLLARCSACCGARRGQPCAPAGIRSQLHHAAQAAGVRRRFALHQHRHAHAVEMSREGIWLIVIQRQFGHADRAITFRYLRGIDNTEIIQAVHERPEPMVPASRRLAPQRCTLHNHGT